MRAPTSEQPSGRLVALALIFALAGALSCASAHEPGPPKPAPVPVPVDTTPVKPAPIEPPPAPPPPPPPARPPAAVVAVAPKPPAPKPKPKPKPKPATAVAVAPKPQPKPKPVPTSATKTTAVHKRRPKPKPKGPTAREIFVRDSIAQAEFVHDSIARDAFVRDSVSRAMDSLARVAIVHDSLARLAFVRDSTARALAYQDSLVRARRTADSIAALAKADSAYGTNGAMPRIEGDPNIQRPTLDVSLNFTDQINDHYVQLQASFARPFNGRKASWQIDLPYQHWDSVSGTKTVNSLANATFTLNRVISARNAGWRQTVSLALTPQTSLVNPSVGNNQWYIQPSYSISHWFANDRLHFRSITSWTYGFAPDTTARPTKKNVIIPRLVLTGRVNDKLSATMDFRPRFDITRDAVYSTLMFQLSHPLGSVFGLQAGYEFPLDSMAKQKVEKSRVYLNLSRVF